MFTQLIWSAFHLHETVWLKCNMDSHTRAQRLINNYICGRMRCLSYKIANHACSQYVTISRLYRSTVDRYWAIAPSPPVRGCARPISRSGFSSVVSNKWMCSTYTMHIYMYILTHSTQSDAVAGTWGALAVSLNGLPMGRCKLRHSYLFFLKWLDILKYIRMSFPNNMLLAIVPVS